MASAGMNRHGLLFTQSLREGESQPQQLGVERRARRCCIDWPSMTSRPNFLWIPPLLKRSYSPSPLMTNAQDYPKCSAGNGSRLLMTGILSFRWRILQHFFPIRLIQFRSTASLAQPKGPDRYLSIFRCSLTLSFRGEREKKTNKKRVPSSIFHVIISRGRASRLSPDNEEMENQNFFSPFVCNPRIGYIS